MKRFLLTLLTIFVSCSPIFGQITCDVFEINSELNKETLSVSLNTDLPDNAVLMVSISRSYWEVGSSDEYSIDYYSEKSTVQEWRNTHAIVVDNSIWETDLQDKQKKLAPLGLGFDVDKISDSVIVRMVVPINQPNPKFGNGNEKLTGKKVNTSGLRTVSDENRIYYTIDGDVSKRSKFADPLSLKSGETYVISQKTPLMSEFDPSDPMKALEYTKEIPPGNLIEVISIKQKDSRPWYEVEVFNARDNCIGIGWINSQALMGQSIQIKE